MHTSKLRNSTAYPYFQLHVLQIQAVAEVQQKEAASSTKKLWGGRFTGATDPLMEKFNESLPFDKRMWQEDIRVQADACFCHAVPAVLHDMLMKIVSISHVQ